MKKQTIWILTIVMAIAFVGLLCIQIFYMKNIVQIRYDQFAQGVRQCLVAVSTRLEQDEARHYLEDDVRQVETSSLAQFIDEPTAQIGIDGIKYSFTTSTGLEADLTIKGSTNEISKLQTSSVSGIAAHYKSVQDAYRDRYIYQKGLLDDVILNIITTASSRPIDQRADSARVSSYLRSELDTLGLKVPFEFAVSNYAGTVLYKSADFNAGEDCDNMFSQTLFPNDAGNTRYYLTVVFPTKKDYIFSSISFMVPAFAFTFILLIIFVYTIILAFRQKKLNEMKNDFINNMTHEFKTPISSISLAAQMLNDQSVRKSPAMLQQISSVITDETKRLRFQVEKVLQLSMFDRRQSNLRIIDVDANTVIFNIVNTFKLKVEKYGGSISANLDAMDAIVSVDEMHFTNVVFNLLDNAVKYRDQERPMRLVLTSRDIAGNRLEITIADNGIGIKRDDLKKIFEKFYRVSTGNRHDVQGFGLGLAYVKKIIEQLGGQISVESEINHGTKFIIILPLSKN